MLTLKGYSAFSWKEDLISGTSNKLKMEHFRLGLKENRKQFWLLVFINALVGGMIGLERTLYRCAAQEFHLTSASVILSFIIVFGLFKAITNYFTGILASRFGRKRDYYYPAGSLVCPFLLY